MFHVKHHRTCLTLLFHVKHKFTVKIAEKDIFYGRNVFFATCHFSFHHKKIVL